MLLLRAFRDDFLGDNGVGLVKESPATRPSAMFSLPASLVMVVVGLISVVQHGLSCVFGAGVLFVVDVSIEAWTAHCPGRCGRARANGRLAATPSSPGTSS
jgi:hypothetical protein